MDVINHPSRDQSYSFLVKGAPGGDPHNVPIWIVP